MLALVPLHILIAVALFNIISVFVFALDRFFLSYSKMLEHFSLAQHNRLTICHSICLCESVILVSGTYANLLMSSADGIKIVCIGKIFAVYCLLYIVLLQ